MTVNRDAIVAIVLLAFSAALFSASYEIRATNYGTMPSDVWPRILIVLLGILSAVYLFRSLTGRMAQEDRPVREDGRMGIGGWLATWRNPIVCYLLFGLYLVSIPWIGMLLGGILFVFLTLTFLGEGGAKSHILHAVVAIVTVGFMWSVFTFALRVILPPGELFEGLI